MEPSLKVCKLIGFTFRPSTTSTILRMHCVLKYRTFSMQALKSGLFKQVVSVSCIVIWENDSGSVTWHLTCDGKRGGNP